MRPYSPIRLFRSQDYVCNEISPNSSKNGPLSQDKSPFGSSKAKTTNPEFRSELDPESDEISPFELSESEETEHERFLTPDECRQLREEAQQYYHRYIALLVLEDFESVARDTSRNLRVLDLFRDYAIEEDDQTAMEGHRPYVMMMRARALASHAVKHEENKAAIHAIDEGIEALKLYYEATGQEEEFKEAGEVDMLREMRDSLVPKLPVSQRAELRQRLEAAIVSENFELAAILRDELRMLGH